MNWLKKNKIDSGGCPFGVGSYNENCKLRHCDRIEACRKETLNSSTPAIEKPAVKGLIIDQENERVDPNPRIEFYKKPGTYEITQRHLGKSDPLDDRNTLKCSLCGRRFIKTQSVNAYKCHRCGKVFCPNHHLPQNHKCSGKKSWFSFLHI